MWKKLDIQGKAIVCDSKHSRRSLPEREGGVYKSEEREEESMNQRDTAALLDSVQGWFEIGDHSL